jgi:hypothetical protein
MGVSGRSPEQGGRRRKEVKRLQRGRLWGRHLWREYKPYPVPGLIHQMVAAVEDDFGQKSCLYVGAGFLGP